MRTAKIFQPKDAEGLGEFIRQQPLASLVSCIENDLEATQLPLLAELDPEGNVIGSHEGQQKFTIGQRRGLGIALSKPAYVVAKDPVLNTVTIGGAELLDTNIVVANETNWLIDECEEWTSCKAKIRYNTPAAHGKVRKKGDTIEVQFDEPQRGGAPGQAVVCYQGTKVVCGGWIGQVS